MRIIEPNQMDQSYITKTFARSTKDERTVEATHERAIEKIVLPEEGKDMVKAYEDALNYNEAVISAVSDYLAALSDNRNSHAEEIKRELLYSLGWTHRSRFSHTTILREGKRIKKNNKGEPITEERIFHYFIDMVKIKDSVAYSVCAGPDPLSNDLHQIGNFTLLTDSNNIIDFINSEAPAPGFNDSIKDSVSSRIRFNTDITRLPAFIINNVNPVLMEALEEERERQSVRERNEMLQYVSNEEDSIIEEGIPEIPDYTPPLASAALASVIIQSSLPEKNIENSDIDYDSSTELFAANNSDNIEESNSDVPDAIEDVFYNNDENEPESLVDNDEEKTSIWEYDSSEEDSQEELVNEDNDLSDEVSDNLESNDLLEEENNDDNLENENVYSSEIDNNTDYNHISDNTVVDNPVIGNEISESHVEPSDSGKKEGGFSGIFKFLLGDKNDNKVDESHDETESNIVSDKSEEPESVVATSDEPEGQDYAGELVEEYSSDDSSVDDNDTDTVDNYVPETTPSTEETSVMPVYDYGVEEDRDEENNDYGDVTYPNEVDNGSENSDNSDESHDENDYVDESHDDKVEEGEEEQEDSYNGRHGKDDTMVFEKMIFDDESIANLSEDDDSQVVSPGDIEVSYVEEDDSWDNK